MIIDILIMVLALFIVLWIVGTIYSVTPLKPMKWFFHDILGWHYPSNWMDRVSKNVKFDGVSYCAKCKRCHKRILQDSQGNWFTPDI